MPIVAAWHHRWNEEVEGYCCVGVCYGNRACRETPLTLKSLARTVDGSTGSLTFTTKSVGRVNMVIAPEGLVTEQGAAVSEATPTRNVIVAIIEVGVRGIFTSRYHFVVA